MTDRTGRPWLVSLGLHLLVGALVLGVASQNFAPPPPSIRMHLVGGRAGPAPAAANRSPAWVPPAGPPGSRSEAPAPAWQEAAAGPGPTPLAVPAPASLDELLGGTGTPPPADAPAVAPGAWTGSSGDGYVAPPLPPPRLAPPQGARWSLVLTVPGAGGFASAFEGLDSGHPDLDLWLETYLRTVSFPPGLDGADYRLRWDLRLSTGKPR